MAGPVPPDQTWRMEQFSRAYVQAVAAAAGVSVAKPEVDDDSIDLTLQRRTVGTIRRSPRLDLQLKATYADCLSHDQLSYDLKVKNYDDLRDTALAVPRILVVVLLPANVEKWVDHSEDQLALFRCGYWLSLRGMEQTDNATKRRVHLDRRSVFNAIPPDDLRAFLTSIGFSVIADDSARADVWASSMLSGGAEILVPKSAGIRDYGLRLAELFSTLSESLDRTQEELLQTVTDVVADIVRVRRPSYNEADASIRLRDGAAMLTGALEMMGAVASSTVAPKAVLPPRRPNQAIDYMNHVELGQSERGSYVVSLISRIAPLLTPGAPGLLEFMEDPFPRKVTTTLALALTAAQSAAQSVKQDGDFSAFGAQVEHGLSSNLCDAVGRLVEDEESSTSISLSISWARSRPSRVAELNAFSFVPSDAVLLKEAAAYLRSREPEVRVLLTGVVTDLHREPTDLDGEVSVSTILEGRTRKLRTPLTGPDYRSAIEAHDEKLPVMFRADIVKAGRSWRASNVSEFRVIRP